MQEHSRELDTLARSRQSTCYESKVIFDDECDDEYKFVGDPLRNNTGKIIRLYYNNCNGIEINLLVKSQTNKKIRKKNDSYLGEEQSSSKFDAIAATMKDWEVNICCLAGTDTAWEHRSTKDAVKRVLKRRIDRCSTLISSSSSA